MDKDIDNIYIKVDTKVLTTTETKTRTNAKTGTMKRLRQKGWTTTETTTNLKTI